MLNFLDLLTVETLMDWFYWTQEHFEELPWPLVEETISRFTFYYPLLMAFVWIGGGSVYYFLWESKRKNMSDNLPTMAEFPFVSILVPCYNEGPNARETIGALLKQRYPNFEVIAINDGSKDNTLEILHEIADNHQQVRVINLASNQGKAIGLRTAALLSNGEILIGIDGDALLAPNATAWIVHHFLTDPAVGAVTGNPRIRNRSTLLGKIQVGEFSAIIGLIKRAQAAFGRIFTVSGVIAGFRKRALHDVGYWSPDMVTEDIDISWKLQLNGWKINYEPNALCWVLMPETLVGLWKQRTRWAQGGCEVLLKYFRSMFRWSSRSMWPLYLECCLSFFWSFLVLIPMTIAAVDWLFDWQPQDNIVDLSPHWTSMLLCITCLIQFFASIAIDSKYEKSNGGSARHYYWMIWYPIAYWMINIGTSIHGSIKALTKKQGQRAVWVTQDRGLR